MEDQAATLLAALKKPSTAVDTKLALFNNLKSNIKHLRVPEAAQAPILECVKLAITASTSAALVSTGFSTLGHLIKRLVLQDQTAVITTQSGRILPLLLDKLGDPRESHRNASSQLLADLWPLCHADVENLMRDTAMKGSNPRAKEMSMEWVVKMNQTEALPFRSFVPGIVANLEDGDGIVRDTAKNAVVELFKTAPEHAKSDLKKQLVAFNVRKSIASYIVAHLGGTAPVEDVVASAISTSTASADTNAGFADSMISEAPPPVEVVPMDPIYVHTQRELDDIFREMLPHFEGRESEGNWLPRDKDTLKLRRITKGNSPSEFHVAFVTNIKSMLDGILKVANSLRTTMSTNGCLLIQELAKTLGPALDPSTEILLQSAVKMCAATKKIAADNGNTTVDAILQNVSYNSRLLQHVAFAASDKNVQPRIYSSNWIKTVIRRHKSHIEHSGGLDQLDKIIKKGLADANPKVREGMRAAYWTFAPVWPKKAEAIMADLDPKQKGLLENAPSNPNGPPKASAIAPSSFSKSVGPSGPRQTLKEKIAEQKRERLAKQMPARPSSAQATFSPVKTAKSTSNLRQVSTASSTPHSARPPSAMSGSTASRSGLGAPSSTTASGALMAAPMRRPRKPEIARPATADPYHRRAGKNVTPSMTPEKTPATKKSVATTKSTIRPRTGTGPERPSPNISPIRSKSRLEQLASHRRTPSGDSARTASPAGSPSKDEELTMVMPRGKFLGGSESQTLPFRKRAGLEKTMSVDSGIPHAGDEDGFTLVIPNMSLPQPSGQQSHQRSPPKSASKLGFGSPRIVGGLDTTPALGLSGSPRVRSPDRTYGQAGDAQADEVQVYEDPFVGDEPGATSTDPDKPVLEELPLNEKKIERRLSSDSVESATMMGDGAARDDEPSRRHHKTTSTSSVMLTNSNDSQVTQERADVLKNRRLLASGIERIRAKTLDAHGFRRLQDLVKNDQDIWGSDGEKFGDLLLALLDYLEAPNDTLKAPPGKAPNLKVQVLATIRAMLALYRKETAVYYSRTLCAILQTRSHYDSASHIASDLEHTANEIVRYGQTSDSLNAVLDLIESTSPSFARDTPSPASSAASSPTPPKKGAPVPNRTTTMGLSVLAQLLQVAQAKNVAITNVQTQRLGKLAVRFLDDTDPDVRKADLEFCISLHERIGGEKDLFWKAVAGAREQHLNLITYFLARRGKA
ncbi:protein STU1 [Lophium mytilinum]|uniref:Protein STU1 n=1 Tax=Lophium mytilinum TaxID=390894 RepID=A0A6A6RF56_9PEZI|nr:protein STU1 [Lophium mytilinum]